MQGYRYTKHATRQSWQGSKGKRGVGRVHSCACVRSYTSPRSYTALPVEAGGACPGYGTSHELGLVGGMRSGLRLLLSLRQRTQA